MNRPVLRTCVGCRQVRDRRELVRLACDPVEGLIVNALQTPGRGAYVCPSMACLQMAWRRKVFLRAFRREVPRLQESIVFKRFETELRRRSIAG